jgi:hypothetical protein
MAARIIHAVNDITPYPEGAKRGEPFMYWDVENETSAAFALIKRYVIVVMSFVIFVLLYKNLLLRDNNNIPLNKCECLPLFQQSVTLRNKISIVSYL